tara:strand:- start:3521 stop:4426 length:906 start_codon:yes stop_codon:yes gene_type:complete
LKEINNVSSNIDSLKEITEIAILEKDNSLDNEILDSLKVLNKDLDDLELKTLFNGEFDSRNVIVSIHAGAGGVESQDWASMIMRMYLRWAEKNKMNTKILEISKGDEAGIKSCTINVSGYNAYGFLESEKGVHRLVRLSPYDSDNARHTSFVLVEILPEIESDIEIDIKTDDLNIESFKAGGAGGQSVQKNSTAIRITHLPTGLKVSCQNERSQAQNKEIAMRILKSRLLALEIKKRDANKKKLKGPHVSAEWGNQIRSYVLHPYKMVKDHRTDFESSDPDKILDGEIQGFIDNYLRKVKN